MSEINSTILDNKLSELKQEATNYYNNFVEKQTNSIDCTDDHYIVDYLDHSLGVFCESLIVSLNKDAIIVEDRQLGKQVDIDFSQLSIADQITILEIYEQNI